MAAEWRLENDGGWKGGGVDIIRPYLVQHDVELVVHAGERLGEDGEGLAGGAGLVGVEEEQNHVGTLGEPLAHALKVVAPGSTHIRFTCCMSITRHDHLESRQIVRDKPVHVSPPGPDDGALCLVARVDGAVDHAWAVYHHEVPRGQLPPDLELRVVDQIGPEVAQTREPACPDDAESVVCNAILGHTRLPLHSPHVWVTDQGRAVLVNIRWPRCNDCKAIVGRSHASGLDLTTHDVVDEGRLARGMVAQQEDKGQQGGFIAVLLQRPSKPIINWLQEALQDEDVQPWLGMYWHIRCIPGHGAATYLKLLAALQNLSLVLDADNTPAALTESPSHHSPGSCAQST